MNTLRRSGCSIVLFLASGLWAVGVGAQPQVLTLLGRSSVEGYATKLSEADSRWLQAKGRLVLAVGYQQIGLYQASQLVF